ncbi:aldo/keto reductase family protein [Sarocladium implicatum]|nr:aldo/keto reductase family protein [Sarocladium implicatum]
MVQIVGKEVGSTGFGLMGLTWREQIPTEEESVAVLKAAFDNGMRLWSGADFYAKPDTPEINSMSIIKAYFTKYPEDADKVVIVIKGGVDARLHGAGSPESTKKSIQGIIDQLGGVKKLDIWNPGRRDPNVPLAETFKAAQEFIDAGQLTALALSEVSAESIREGAQVTKLALCELELSMFSPDILRNGIAAACAEFDVPVMAYSPIGRGLLTGRFTESAPPEGIIAQRFPRLNGDNLKHNLRLTEETKALAAKKGCTPGQLALAWVRAQSGLNGNPVVIPIPGSTTVERVAENAKEVKLTAEEEKEVTKVVDEFEVAGTRYPDGAPIAT